MTINYAKRDFAAEVRTLTDGNGVNVVYDSVGKDTYEKSLDCLAPLGVLVIFGQASGPVPPFDTAVPNAKDSIGWARPSLAIRNLTRPPPPPRSAPLRRGIASQRVFLILMILLKSKPISGPYPSIG